MASCRRDDVSGDPSEAAGTEALIAEQYERSCADARKLRKAAARARTRLAAAAPTENEKEEAAARAVGGRAAAAELAAADALVAREAAVTIVPRRHPP